jgi:hypothetical protein
MRHDKTAIVVEVIALHLLLPLQQRDLRQRGCFGTKYIHETFFGFGANH